MSVESIEMRQRDFRSLRQGVRTYARPSMRLAFTNLILTFSILVASFWWFLEVGSIIAYLAIPVSSICLVRLFIIQHDCGHNSYFGLRNSNFSLGTAISLLTLVPHKVWVRSHNKHHASNGHLDGRGVNDIELLTVREFRSLGVFAKMQYRLYRNPFFLFLIAPFFLFVLVYRLPRPFSWVGIYDILGHNILIAFLVSVLYYQFGSDYIIFYCITLYFASSIGVIIFYLQHNFEHTFWAGDSDWSHDEAAIYGSSVLKFGRLFDLLTLNIAYHDLHHLNPKVPSYRLRACFESNSDQLGVNQLSMREAFKCLKMKLWDEDKRTMVSFSELETK